jgi:hypothetical protein
MPATTLPPQITLLVALALAFWLVAHNLPAALLFVFPKLMRTSETDDDGSLDPAHTPSMERIDADLRELGFVKLGAIEVCPPLSRCLADLVYGAPGLTTFADVNARGGSLHVTLVTPFQGGEAVLTSNFRRRGRHTSRLMVGGLPGHGVPEIWAAHRRRIAQLAEGSRPARPWTDITLAGRLAANDRYYAGAGKSELRTRGALPLTMLSTGLVLMAYAGVQLVRLV